MQGCRRGFIRGLTTVVGLALVISCVRIAEGHAILKSSSPAANATVTGPEVPIILKFNVRVDAARSKVQLLHPDNSVTDLKLDKESSPDTLGCNVKGLTPGAYTIRWQVLAPDGHITRGEVPFTVKAG
jgi:methionine-rich copper-binding protein CopC